MTLKATIKHLVKDADKPIKAFADVVIDDSVVMLGLLFSIIGTLIRNKIRS